MPIAFSTWVALLNNFVIEVSGFSGVEIGWLQSVRAPVSCCLRHFYLVFYKRTKTYVHIAGSSALAVAVTALFPEFKGLIITTLISSIGFHYHVTVNQSLQLQWLKKETAPSSIGWIVAAGSGSAFFVYIAIIILYLILILIIFSFISLQAYCAY